jgi:hypothetical protein
MYDTNENNNPNCKICNSKTEIHDKATILNKYNAVYYICPNCGFIQTENPYWLEESYSKAIAKADTGIMMRNLQNSYDLLFFTKFIKCANSLDFGGGHGILTRIMRDYGFNFFHYDKYADNFFADSFEGSLDNKYDLVTSFENFEHFVEPMEEIEKIMAMTDVLYFSTCLVPDNIPLIKEWWYYSPSTGQHISFYSKKSLEIIAKKYNLHLMTNNSSIHILSRFKLDKHYFKYYRLYNKLGKINANELFKRRSLTMDDHYKIIGINKIV